MDIISIITALGLNGVLIAVLGWWRDRRKDNIQADTLEVAKVDQIIAQANARVKQYIDDATRLRSERDEARNECKGQRKAKQDWRDKYMETQQNLHDNELENSELKSQLREARFHVCTVNGCVKREPPRNRESEKQ
jgi:septal ring factor EnvC (AmiA/AmiB activator)